MQNQLLLRRAVAVRGLAKEAFGGFHQRFGKRWVSVNTVSQVTGHSGGFDGDDSLGNHLTGSAADDADTKDTFGIGVNDQFRQTLCS